MFYVEFQHYQILINKYQINLAVLYIWYGKCVCVDVDLIVRCNVIPFQITSYHYQLITKLEIWFAKPNNKFPSECIIIFILHVCKYVITVRVHG